MATYVLIHGAWHGGWCWARVAPLLTAQGHAVYAPSLTGHGARRHLLAPSVGLTTHIDDVVGLLEEDELTQVILVGHSYGGMVITGVAAQAADRLSQLVYLDAFVPADGQSQFDLVPAPLQARFLEDAKGSGQGWAIAPPPLERYGVTDADDLAWASANVTPQSLRTLTEAVRVGESVAHIPRTYIACTAFDGPFAPAVQRARTEPGWQYRELATGHDAMLTAPAELAEVLLELAVPASVDG